MGLCGSTTNNEQYSGERIEFAPRQASTLTLSNALQLFSLDLVQLVLQYLFTAGLSATTPVFLHSFGEGISPPPMRGAIVHDGIDWSNPDVPQLIGHRTIYTSRINDPFWPALGWHPKRRSIYVADAGAVYEFSPSGEQRGVKGGLTATSIAVDANGKLLATDTHNQKVYRFAAEGGVHRATVWRFAARNNQVASAARLAVHQHTNQLALVQEDAECMTLAATGRFPCGKPRGVAVSSTFNEVYVSDARKRSIQVFDMNGQRLRAFGFEKLLEPGNLTLDAHEEHVLVCDTSAHCIVVFRRCNGSFVRTIKDGIRLPYSVCVDDQGHVYVTERNKRGVRVYG